MPLDNQEKFTLAFESLGVGQKVFASIANLGPAPHKALDFVPIVGAKPTSVIYKALAEYDAPVHDAKDLIGVLDLEEGGNLANILTLVSDTLRDIKD